MRDYSKVSPQFWLGATGKALRGDKAAQIATFYLMTCGHASMIGVFSCPLIYLAHETGLTMEEASKGLERGIQEGFCTYDFDRELVWVHEMARFQIGAELKANDKQVSSVRKAYMQIPEGKIRQGFYTRYRFAFHLPLDEKYETKKEGALKGDRSPSEAPTKPIAVAVAVTEDITVAGINPSPDGEGRSHASPGADENGGKLTTAVPDCPHKEIISLYQKHLPRLPFPRSWEGQRQANLRARWRWVLTAKKLKTGERYATDRETGLAFFDRYFKYVSESDFLTNRDGKWLGCDLPWLVKSENFEKVISGKYENRDAA